MKLINKTVLTTGAVIAMTGALFGGTVPANADFAPTSAGPGDVIPGDVSTAEIYDTYRIDNFLDETLTLVFYSQYNNNEWAIAPPAFVVPGQLFIFRVKSWLSKPDKSYAVYSTPSGGKLVLNANQTSGSGDLSSCWWEVKGVESNQCSVTKASRGLDITVFRVSDFR